MIALGLLVAMAALIRENQHLRQQLAEAHTDKLTGLPDRYAADRAFATADHDHTLVSVGIADINGLKAVNDQFGHLTGDELIKSVTHALQVTMQGTGGLVVRLGGDEFLLIAPMTAHQLCALCETAPLDGSAAIGVSSYDGNARQALARADLAMYIGKQNKRQVTIYNPALGTPKELRPELPDHVRRRIRITGGSM